MRSRTQGATMRPSVSICLSVRTQQLENCSVDFHEIWYREVLLNTLDTSQFSLKSDNNGHYIKMYTRVTARNSQIFISGKNVSNKSCRKNQTQVLRTINLHFCKSFGVQDNSTKGSELVLQHCYAAYIGLLTKLSVHLPGIKSQTCLCSRWWLVFGFHK
jgi:hypothetical protein